MKFVKTKDEQGKTVVINLESVESAYDMGDYWIFHTGNLNISISKDRAAQIIFLMNCDIVQ